MTSNGNNWEIQISQKISIIFRFFCIIIGSKLRINKFIVFFLLCSARSSWKIHCDNRPVLSIAAEFIVYKGHSISMCGA